MMWKGRCIYPGLLSCFWIAEFKEHKRYFHRTEFIKAAVSTSRLQLHSNDVAVRGRYRCHDVCYHSYLSGNLSLHFVHSILNSLPSPLPHPKPRHIDQPKKRQRNQTQQVRTEAEHEKDHDSGTLLWLASEQKSFQLPFRVRRTRSARIRLTACGVRMHQSTGGRVPEFRFPWALARVFDSCCVSVSRPVFVCGGWVEGCCA